MKNVFFTLLLGGLSTFSAFASDVTVSVAGNNKYQVLIDGRSIETNGYYGNSITLNNLRPGQHSLQVYKGNTNSRWNDRNVVYSSDFSVRPQYDLAINVDKKGRVQMNEKFNNDYGRNDGYGRNNGDWRNDRDRRNGRDNDYDRNNGFDRNNGSYNNGRYPNGNYDNGYNRAMNSSDFNQLVSRIKSQWFSGGKLNTAKEGVSSNYFNTAQVRQLLQLFSSDNEKLELAKLAYRNTVDQRSYSALYDVFSYQNSRDELDRYIRSSR